MEWFHVECSACTGAMVFLGTLGNLDWFRCRHCGAECSVQAGHVSILD